jgi:hypothetical protein
VVIEVDISTVLAAVGIDILLGASALIVALRNNKIMGRRVDRVEQHLQLPPLEAAEGK